LEQDFADDLLAGVDGRCHAEQKRQQANVIDMFETIKYDSREERIAALKQMVLRSKQRHEQGIVQLEEMRLITSA